MLGHGAACHPGAASGAVKTLFSSYVSSLPLIMPSCMPRTAGTADGRGTRTIILVDFERRTIWCVVCFQSWHPYNKEKLLKIW